MTSIIFDDAVVSMSLETFTLVASEANLRDVWRCIFILHNIILLYFSNSYVLEIFGNTSNNRKLEIIWMKTLLSTLYYSLFWLIEYIVLYWLFQILLTMGISLKIKKFLYCVSHNYLQMIIAVNPYFRINH